MKLNIILLFIVFTIFNCNGQDSNKEIRIVDKNTGFEMVLPKGFQKLTDNDVDEAVKMSKKKLKNLDDYNIDISASEVNMFKKDENNYFLLDISDYDPKIKGEYIATVKTANNLLYETYKKVYLNSKLDSVTKKIFVDKIPFTKYSINVNIPSKLKMKAVSYTALINGKDFMMAIVYIDDKIGMECKNAIEKNTKFNN